MVGAGNLFAQFLCGGQYADAGDAGWAVTLVSIPVYAALFRQMGVTGLAWASDIGMMLSVATLAALLHKYKLVNLSGLEFGELARALLAAVIGFVGTAWCVRLMDLPRGHRGECLDPAVGTVVWAALCGVVLVGTGSKLPRQLLRR